MTLLVYMNDEGATGGAGRLRVLSDGLLRLRLGSGRLLGRRSHDVVPSTLRRIALRPGRLLPIRAWLPRWGFWFVLGVSFPPYARVRSRKKDVCPRANARVAAETNPPKTHKPPFGPQKSAALAALAGPA